MADYKADDPGFEYRMYKKIGYDGRMYPDIDTLQSEFGAYLLLATTAAQLLYSQVSGTYVHLRSMALTATGSSAVLATLVNGSSSSAGTNKMSIAVASGATAIRTYILNDLRGPVFTKSIYVTGTKGARVSITGIMDPNLPSV
jgi:hypothetical protein